MVRALKIIQSEQLYLKLMKPGDVNHAGKKTCLVCNSIRTTTTFTTKACGEIFKIQSGPLNFNSEKVLYLLKCKCVVRLLMLEKPKLNFDIGSITRKANTELSGKETEKYTRNVFMIIIVWMVI